MINTLNLKKIAILIIILLLLGTYEVSKAQVEFSEDIAEQSYLFHLYFDNGSLIIDRTSPKIYEISTREYTFPENANPPKLRYEGKIFSDNEQIQNFVFDPREFRLDQKIDIDRFAAGQITIAGPYARYADRVQFYDDKDKLILTISVANTRNCNLDSKCDGNLGEDINNCPSDCKTPNAPTFLPPLSQTTTTPNGSPTSSVLSVLISGAIIVIVGIIILWLVIRKKNKDNSSYV